MWNEKMIMEYLQKALNKQRYEHSLRVMDSSVELAKHYGADEAKAKLAGLVHDCAKNMKDEEIINIIEKYGYNIEDIYKRTPNLMHGLAGALIGRHVMGIEDEEIFNAICYHTTGKKSMTMLEKIIYIADYIEPMRNFPGVEELRKATYINIDEALLLSFDNTIKYVISRGQLLHLDTIEARNSILCDRM